MPTKKRRVFVLLVGVVGLAAIAAGCRGGPTGPGSQANGSTVTRVEIAGPSTIAPGETVRFTLTAFLGDGSSRDVSTQAVWTSSNASVLKVDATGLATGIVVGEGTIGGVLAQRGSGKPFVVTPPGTFRLRGIVTEADTTARVLGAEVEVRSGSADVLRTATGEDGSFLLFGVPPEAELQISHSAYTRHVQNIRLAEHALLNLQLTLAEPRPSLTGTYTLTMGSAECPIQGGHLAPLPGNLRQRTYTALLTQSGKNLEVTLTGEEFGPRPAEVLNRFFGTMEGGQVKFRLIGPDPDYYEYYYSNVFPNVAEILADGTYLIPSGLTDLRVSGAVLKGTLTGSLTNRVAPRLGRVIARCAGTFPFTLSR